MAIFDLKESKLRLEILDWLRVERESSWKAAGPRVPRPLSPSWSRANCCELNVSREKGWASLLGVEYCDLQECQTFLSRTDNVENKLFSLLSVSLLQSNKLVFAG